MEEGAREALIPLPVVIDGEIGNHPAKARFLTYFYVSHFLSRWGSRMWEFGVGLFMIAIWPDSLLLTSVYGLVEDLAVASLGVSVGKWVDTTPRLKAVQISLGMRNGSVMAAALALVILLLDPDFALGQYKTFTSLIVLVNLFGGVSALAALATNIAVERDWVLAIAEGKRVATLEELNSVMRGIDLTCKLMAPVLVGIIMSCVSVLAAAVFLSLWNVVSIGFEYYFLRCLYSGSPELQQKKTMVEKSSIKASDDRQQNVPDTTDANTESSISSPVRSLADGDIEGAHEEKADEDIEECHEEKNSFQGDCSTDMACSSQGSRANVRQWIANIYHKASHLHVVEGCKVYARQEMLLAALALAMLYFTVLSFGSLMTAALNSKGIPAYVLGLARGFSALVGISATLAYPKVQARLQTIRTGLWSIVMQWGFLSLCVASSWAPNAVVSSALLMGGVATSRFGLWMFDLAVLQLMQESTPEYERGIVGGVQSSVQSFLEMLSFVAGMLISNPEDFDKLVYLSYGAVTVALILYTVQVYRVRGHLFHLNRVFRSQ